MTKSVVIIGGGPAGLTAGYCLGKEGIPITVFEADAESVGGISRTAKYKDFCFDIGGHRFFSKSREVEDLWTELLPEDFLVRPRSSRIFYRGKFFSYPLRPAEAFVKLGPWESFLCGLSYLRARVLPHSNPQNFEQWVTNQFGARLFRIFFKTYTEKVWGMSCTEISADWAAQRIKGLSLSKAVLSALKPKWLSRKKGSVIKTLINSFRYPRKGPGMLWEATARKIRDQGGIVEMGATVTRCRYDAEAGEWEVTWVRDGEEHSLRSQHVISSTPIRQLATMLEPPLGPRAAEAAAQLRYRDFLTVALVARERDVIEDNWIYIHEPGVKVGRVQNFKSWSPEMVPDPSLACFGLEYFCFEGDGLWTMADEDLIALGRDELVKLGIARAEDILDGCVVRQPKAYPVYDDIYAEAVRTIRDDLAARYPNLHLVGRNGMHKYNNQDHSMMTAMLCAKNIVAGRELFDLWEVNEDAEYHETVQEPAARDESSTSGLRAVPKKVALAVEPAPAGLFARVWNALRVPETFALTLIGGLLLLRFLYIFSHGVDSDEPQNLHVVYQWLKGDLPYLDQFDNHTPLFHWLFLPFAALVGETPNIVPLARLALVPLSFGAVGLLYLLVRRLYERSVALWSIVLTLALADWSLKSIEFRPDVLWMFLWFGALCVLVRPERRSGPALFLLAGLLLGSAAMVSVKTAFLLPALALGWMGAWLLSREFRSEYPWPRILRCTLAGGAGLVVIPAVVAVCFASRGALDEMAYCVYGINKDPFFSDRSWIFFAGLPVAVLVALYLLRPGGMRAAYRTAVFLSAATYTLAVTSFGPYEALAKQTFLPVYPLLLAAACHFVMTLRPWSPRATIALGGATATALTVVMMIGSPPLQDGNAEQRALLQAVLDDTEPTDYVMDMKGETIFRRRPVYMAYVGNTERKMEIGQIAAPDPEQLGDKDTAVTVERTAGYPDAMQDFIKDNYVSTTAGELRVAGKVLKPSWENGKWTQHSNIEVAGKYVIVDDGKITSEITLPEDVVHTFVFNDRDRRVLFWKDAWDDGLRPSEQ